jgi:YgiT-type zinc finger domain-containing protein
LIFDPTAILLPDNLTPAELELMKNGLKEALLIKEIKTKSIRFLNSGMADNMECALCKVGTTAKGKVTITLERNQAIVLIKDIPAEICTNCGYYYLSEEITRILMEKGNEAVANGAELEVFSLKVA